jgi:hypothetical protein
VFKVIATNGRLDHLLRCLTTSLSQAGNGYPIQEIRELFAMTNLFISVAVRWEFETVPNVVAASIADIVHRIRSDLLDDTLSAEAMYLLRAMLAIGAYVDGCQTVPRHCREAVH